MKSIRLLGAALAAVFFLVGPVQAEIKKEWVDYADGAKKLKALVVHDDAVSGKRPAVLMLHARDGMTAKNQEFADIWAKQGYLVFMADLFGYGEGVLPKDNKEMAALTDQFRKDPGLSRSRTRAAHDTLAKHPLADTSKVAMIGYCFGGDVGVEYSASGAPLLLSVTIHGSFRKYEPGWAQNIKGRYLILHGAEDKSYPLVNVLSVVDELRKSKVPFDLEVYSGTGHGFSSPDNKEEERSNAQSIVSASKTLKEVFGL